MRCAAIAGAILVGTLGFAESASADPGEEPERESGAPGAGRETLEGDEEIEDDEGDEANSEEESEPEGGSEGEIEGRLDRLESKVEQQTSGEEQSEKDETEETETEGESSVDQRVSELESDLDGGEDGDSGGGSESSQTALNPELSVILDAGVAWQKNSPTLVGGSDPKRFGPFLQSTELALRADVDPFFTFDSHLIADLSGLKVGEAYGTTLALPGGLQARFGKFKTRFGRVNPRHLHAWKFTVLPLVNGKLLGPAGLNGLGAEVSQILPLPWYVEWVLAVQDLSAPATGHAFFRDRERVEGPFDLVLSGRLKQFFDLGRDADLLWGLNAAVGRNDAPRAVDDGSYRTGIYGTDLFLKYKPAARGGRSELGWQTEAMLRRRRTTRGVRTDAGGYSYLYWAPEQTWQFGGRYEYVSGPFEEGGDYLHPEWLEARQRAGVAASFFPSSFSRFRLEYMAGGFRRGASDLAHTVILQTQLVTGAHGAHKF